MMNDFKGLKENRFWKIINGIVYTSGALFLGIVIPACAIFYIFFFRLAFAALNKPESSNNQSELHFEYYNKSIFTDSYFIGELDNLFETTLDSLMKEENFIDNYPQGSIKYHHLNDSITVLLEYYLDCGCSLEENKMDILRCSVVVTDEGHLIVNNTQLLKSISREKTAEISP